MSKSIIIIGGGLTGLSVGCYGQMNGYKTRIFEMHKIAGGVATAWRRQGYTIDGAMNWLVGTNPNSSYYKVWNELGAAPVWKIYNHEFSQVIENREGKVFKVYCDADQFEEYLLKLAPEDATPIKEFTKALRRVNPDFPVGKPSELSSITDKMGAVKMLPFMNFMRKWSKVTAVEFAQHFKNAFLREMFAKALGGDSALAMSLLVLGMQHRKIAGYVLGGALALVKPIEKHYQELGGEISFNARVEKILVENDKAVGIRLADGTEHRADWIVSAGDGRTVIFDMLGGKYIDDSLKARYDNPKLFEPLIYIALGVNRKFEDVPPSINGTLLPIDTPIMVAGKKRESLDLRLYNFDPSMAPAGKNLAVVAFTTEYDYWKKLKENPVAYKAEKERICNDVIAVLEKRFPGITKQIEIRDIATPITWERYTGNWRGSYEGWQFDVSSFTGGMKKTLPGLANFYMAGQWVNPGGGMPTAGVSGRHTLQLICHDDGKTFTSAKP
jgi:phytoene dehydrogenase-like protein